MSRGKWVLLAGLGIVVLLIWIPPILIMTCGWPANYSFPDATPPSAPVEPIAEPNPATGLPPDLIRWILVSGALSLGIALGAWLLALLFRKEIAAGVPAPRGPLPYLLVLLGVASLATYGLNFLLPFPLRRYYNLKGISIGAIADRDPSVALATAAATVALFLLYGLAHRFCRGRDSRRLWAIVLVGALLFALVNFLLPTLTTLDPYDYIARGRIAGLHSGNPYVQAPSAYPADPFLDYVSWRDATSAYGPLWETLSTLIGRFAGGQLWPQLLAYKGLALGSYFLSVLLIAAILRRVAPQRALAGTLLFAWNPLILMEGVANAHNDVLMVALLLGAFWLLSQTLRAAKGPAADGQSPPLPAEGNVSEQTGQTSAAPRLLYGGLAMLLLAAAVLVKFVPILFLPFVFLYLLAGERSWRRWLGWGLLLVLPVVLLTAEYYLAFWKWPEITSSIVRRADMFRWSTASVTREALLPHLDEKVIGSLVRWPFLGLFALGYLLLLGRAVWTLGRPGERLAVGLGLVGGALGGILGGVLWWNFGGWGLALGETWTEPLRGIDGLILTASLGGIIGGQVGAGVVYLTKRGDRGEHPWDLLVAFCSGSFLLYLLLANFWFWPWYLILPIALLALSGDERLFAPLALASCGGELGHLGWTFLWYWWGITWDTTYQMDALVVFWTLVPALLVYAILGLKRRFARQ